MLGHASAAMTLDVYSGLFDDDLDGVADRMDAAAWRQERSRVPLVCPVCAPARLSSRLLGVNLAPELPVHGWRGRLPIRTAEQRFADPGFRSVRVGWRRVLPAIRS